MATESDDRDQSSSSFGSVLQEPSFSNSNLATSNLAVLDRAEVDELRSQLGLDSVGEFVEPQDYEQLLSDLVFYRTYAKTLADGRKETPAQTTLRVRAMHIEKFPHLESQISEVFEQVFDRRVVPSMRSNQFAGDPIKRSNSRLYNCSFLNICSWRDICDMFFKLMNGCGVGYSVQRRHTEQLPTIPSGVRGLTFVVQDDKESWSDSLEALFLNPLIGFDYSPVRLQGSKLSTGGTASGPGPLAAAHRKIRAILHAAAGRKLRPIEVHSILTLMSDVVVVGGVRRAALISLFDADDTEMLDSKTRNWWETNPHFARANNSAVLHRQDPQFESKLLNVLLRCFSGGFGEPGVFLTNDYDYGGNPCNEVSLKHRQLCNLTEVNAAACKTREEFREAVWAASAIGTIQASWTNFNYVHPGWKQNCDQEALLGVSITGQAQAWGRFLSDATFLRECAQIALEANAHWARLLGINEAARIGCTKPSGSTSAYLKTTSGIHAAHAPFHLRRVRVDRSDPIAIYLIKLFGLGAPESGSIVEKDGEKPDQNIVVTIPINKQGAIIRDQETSLQLLERSKHIFENWIKPSHRSGPNYHNVSLTVSYKPEEQHAILDWMLQNKDFYTGVSFLPFSDARYVQAPFEAVDETSYREWTRKFDGITVDFSGLDFSHQEDRRGEEVACGGGSCEIK